MNGKSAPSTPAARRTTRRPAAAPLSSSGAENARPVATIRAARRGDLDAVIALDAQATGIEKREYWRTLFRRYGEPSAAERQFLVALDGATVVGYVIGEVRVAEVNGRGVTFEVEARDNVEPICKCRHSRFVVDVAKTGQRLAAKAQKTGLA